MKVCRKKELQSTIGSLVHACKVVVNPGRTFLRRLIDLLVVTKKPYHHIRLTWDVRSDIEWWHRFAAQWNGVPCFNRKQSKSRTSSFQMHQGDGGVVPSGTKGGSSSNGLIAWVQPTLQFKSSSQ